MKLSNFFISTRVYLKSCVLQKWVFPILVSNVPFAWEIFVSRSFVWADFQADENWIFLCYLVYWKSGLIKAVTSCDEGGKENMLTAPEWIIQKAEEFSSQSSLKESRPSTSVSKIDRGGREANVACAILVVVFV